MSPKVIQNDDKKLEVDGVIFHRDEWQEKPQPVNPFAGLQYIKKKHEMGVKFGTFWMDHRLPKLEGSDEFGYEKENELKAEFLKGLGFTLKEYNSYPWTGWSHKLKVDDLRDLLRQTFEKDLSEELADYHQHSEELNQYNEDMQNREIFARRIEHFISFKNAFKVRKTSFEELIEKVELSIGKGHYRRLATRCESYRLFEFVPEDEKVNSFEAMAYAKEWLSVFGPVSAELDQLENVLDMPYGIEANLNGIPDSVKAEMWLSDLVEFRYQDFLTFLMDFRLRFGRHDNDYRRDRKVLSGWMFHEYDYRGEFVRGGPASEWDVFKTQINVYGGRGGTWGDWLLKLALNGRIEAISDPERMRDIVNRTNSHRHRHNNESGYYKKAIVLCTRVEPKEEVE